MEAAPGERVPGVAPPRAGRAPVGIGRGGLRPPLCSREVGPGLAVASLCARPYSVHVEPRPWVGDFRAGRWCGPDAPGHCGWPVPSCWEDTLEVWFCPPRPPASLPTPTSWGLRLAPCRDSEPQTVSRVPEPSPALSQTVHILPESDPVSRPSKHACVRALGLGGWVQGPRETTGAKPLGNTTQPGGTWRLIGQVAGCLGQQPGHQGG